MLSDVARSSISGAAFGAALSASRVWIPTVIINQMRLKDFHMLEAFLTASASSAVIMLTLERLGIAERSIRPNSTLNWFSAYDANIVGGAMIGIGMSLTGACPGTVLVQLAHRVPSSTATALGSIFGGIAYAAWGNILQAKPSSNAGASSSCETIDSKLKINPTVVFTTFETLLLATIATSHLKLPGRSFAMISPVVGGLLIGTAQMLSIILTSKPVGVSTAYEQLGKYICRAFRIKNTFDTAESPMSVVFALGVFASSLVFSLNSSQPSQAQHLQISASQALMGGFIMTFGARLAGGCTSGHGLSGLAAMSYSSLITVPAMFCAGIGVAMLRR